MLLALAFRLHACAEALTDRRGAAVAALGRLDLPGLDAWGLPGSAAAQWLALGAGPSSGLAWGAVGYAATARTTATAADVFARADAGGLPGVDLDALLGDPQAGLLAALDDRPGLAAAGGTPLQVAQWWQGLSPALRAALVLAHPDRLGGLDGVAVADRDRANRLVLERGTAELELRLAALEVLARDRPVLVGGPGPLAGAVAVLRSRLAVLEAVRAQLGAPQDGRTLLVLEPGVPGRAAIGFGDLAHAEDVAVLVPGMGSSVARTLDDLSRSARSLQRRAATEDPGRRTATIAWMGYAAPIASVWSDARAADGAPALRGLVRGLDAAAVAEQRDVHLTVVAHSYGTLVAGLALSEPTGVDDLVLLGSPGVGVDRAADLAVPAGHVLAAEAEGDLVADLAHFGTDPDTAAFGARGLPTGRGTDADGSPLAASHGHSQYYREDSQSLRALALVVTGHLDEVPCAPATGGSLGQGLRDLWELVH